MSTTFAASTSSAEISTKLTMAMNSGVGADGDLTLGDSVLKANGELLKRAMVEHGGAP